MNEQLRKICAMLKSDRPERQCAAAMVLGEMGIREQVVVRNLGEILAIDNRLLRLYVLEALQRIHSRAALPYLLPLLTSDGDLPGRVIDVIASLGTSVVFDLKREYERSPFSRRRAIITALARIRGRDAVTFLLNCLLNDDPEIVREIPVAFKLQVNGIPDVERRDLHKRVEAFLRQSKVAQNHNAMIGALKILGYLGESAGKRTLLTFSSPQYPSPVRRNSLQSLRRLLADGGGNTEALKKLLGYLGETDFANIVQPTLELLYGIEIPATLADPLLKLTKSAHPAVRKFALKKLGNYDNAKIARELIDHLMCDDPLMRDTAAESLGRLSAARTRLLDRLEGAADIDRAWTIAKVLKSHSDGLRRDMLDQLSTRSIQYLQEGNRLWEPVLYVIRNADPDYYYDLLLRWGIEFKKTKRYEEASLCLRLSSRSERFGSEARFELAVVELKASPKDLSKAARSSNGTLSLFEILVRDREFSLLARLKKEKAILDLEDLYFLGFHFTEKFGEEKNFGAELLRYVISKSPRTKLARSARNKLKLEGLA